MDSEAGAVELKWYASVNTKFHLTFFPSEEEYVAKYAEESPDVIIFEATQLNYLTRTDEIKMYLLAEENLVELATRTGMTEKQFRDMWRYDLDFGVTTKIYLIPAI